MLTYSVCYRISRFCATASILTSLACSINWLTTGCFFDTLAASFKKRYFLSTLKQTFIADLPKAHRSEQVHLPLQRTPECHRRSQLTPTVIPAPIRQAWQRISHNLRHCDFLGTRTCNSSVHPERKGYLESDHRWSTITPCGFSSSRKSHISKVNSSKYKQCSTYGNTIK